jgi:hypothetical protein
MSETFESDDYFNKLTLKVQSDAIKRNTDYLLERGRHDDLEIRQLSRAAMRAAAETLEEAVMAIQDKRKAKRTSDKAAAGAEESVKTIPLLHPSPPKWYDRPPPATTVSVRVASHVLRILPGFLHLIPEPPEKAYRIKFSDSQTIYSHETGFKAQLQWEAWPSDADFIPAVENHIYWRREPTPFISVFLEERHARNWARSMANGREYEIMEIALRKTGVKYQVKDLLEKLWIVPREVEPHFEDEVLVVNEIPASAIRRTITEESILVPSSAADVDSDDIEQKLSKMGLD